MNVLFLVLLIAVASAQYDNAYQHDHYGYDTHDAYGRDDYGHYDYDEHGHDDYDHGHDSHADYGHADHSIDTYDDNYVHDYYQYDDSDNLKKYQYDDNDDYIYQKYGEVPTYHGGYTYYNEGYDGDNGEDGDFVDAEYKAHLYPRFDLLKDLQVSGDVSDKTKFSGTLTITGVKYENNVLYVKGYLKESGSNIPAEFEWTNATIIAKSDKKRQANATCPVLNLVLGPLNLNLLGLVVNLNTIILNIIAVAGPNNLLGNLLCAVANLLSGNLTTQLQALLGNLVAILNGLLPLA